MKVFWFFGGKLLFKFEVLLLVMIRIVGICRLFSLFFDFLWVSVGSFEGFCIFYCYSYKVDRRVFSYMMEVEKVMLLYGDSMDNVMWNML